MKRKYEKGYQKNTVVSVAAVAAAIVFGLTACGSRQTSAELNVADENAAVTDNGVKETDVSEGETAETNPDLDAFAGELLTRAVTAEDAVTDEVIGAVISKLKETNAFEQLDEFKIASGDWVYYAQDRGWFEELFGDNNTAVTAIEGSTGNEVQLMERGELHLTNRMLYPYLLFKSQGADITAVALSADPNADIVSILVNGDSDIQTFDDLKGKTIGSWNAGCQYVALIEQTLDRGWVEGQDWTYVNISNDSLKTALQAKEIDAISTHPFANVNGEIANGNFREIANAKEGGVYVTTGGASVTFAYGPFAENYPNILKAALKLRELVNAYIILNEEEVCGVLEEITRTPAENNIFYIERRDETYYTTQESVDDLIRDTETYQNWLISNTDEFTEDNKVASEDFFNTEFFY